MPNSITYLNQTPEFERFVVWCGSKNRKGKRHVLERDWSACSKYDNHSRLNSQHNGEGPICPFNKHKILHFDNG